MAGTERRQSLPVRHSEEHPLRGLLALEQDWPRTLLELEILVFKGVQGLPLRLVNLGILLSPPVGRRHQDLLLEPGILLAQSARIVLPQEADHLLLALFLIWSLLKKDPHHEAKQRPRNLSSPLRD